ncbi:MAG TPA: UbiD family decarboxylase, partial [Candidatus Binatia bacterium]
MPDGYYGDFRAYLEELDKRGKLHRWRRPVNKDTELMPLMRLQYRGIADEKRQAFLFENVLDSRNRKHAIKVATGVYGSSREIISLGLACDEPLQIYEKWRHALAAPIEPGRVSHAAVHEEIYTGTRLKEFG